MTAPLNKVRVNEESGINPGLRSISHERVAERRVFNNEFFAHPRCIYGKARALGTSRADLNDQ